MNKNDLKEAVDSLAEFINRLDSMKSDEERQSTELLATQRAIKPLSPLKELIETNLNRFDSDWPAIQASLQRIRTELDGELVELGKELDSLARQKIDQSLKDISKADIEEQHSAESLDKSLAGEVRFKRIEAEYAEALAKARLHELHLESITKRISDAETRLRRAGSIATKNDSLRAQKYVLLKLVEEDLARSRIEVDYRIYESNFEFPEDKNSYESLVVIAAWNYAKSQETLFQDRATEEAENMKFKQRKTKISTNLQSREDRIVAEAKESINRR
jgi:hypothetical protein